MRAILLTSLLIFSITPLKAQDQQVLINYSEIELKSGLPTLMSGEQINLDFDNPQYGTISPGDVFSGVYLLVDNFKPDAPKFWYLLEKKDSTVSLGSLPIEDHQESLKNAKMNFSVTSGAQYTYSIELIHDSRNNRFFYKWIGSQKNNSPQPVKNTAKLEEGRQIPSFSVPLLNEEIFRLVEEKGRIVVVNWWSTSCSPCIAEIPGFNKLVEKYNSNGDIIFLAIAWDSETRVKNFLAQNEFNYKHALYNDETVKIFGGAFPRNLVIDRRGDIAYSELGADEDQWKKIDQVLQLITSIGK